MLKLHSLVLTTKYSKKGFVFYLHLGLCCLFACTLLPAQGNVSTDSVPVYDLLSLTVSASPNILPIAAPVAQLGATDINRYDQQSLLAGFNSIPGARFEERAPGSYRISIRGSSLRAPFGVRNVKVYWNGFPLTEPGGDTQLNLLDPINTQQLTVFKGPAGSMYGSGTGGALLLQSSTPPEEESLDRITVQAGSFGSGRLSWQHERNQDQNNRHFLRLAHQRTDGYRQHSQFARSVAELGIIRQKTPDQGSSIHALLTGLNYEIPGGLNPTQYAEDPRQARPGSIDQDASILFQNLLVGARFYGLALQKQIRHETGIYASGNRFKNPFNIDYKIESNLGLGGRSVLSHKRSIPGLGDLKIDGGIEAQAAFKFAQNYGRNNGEPGDLNFIDNIISWQALVFTQGKLSLAQNWSITLGLSLQKLKYDVDRTFSREGQIGNTNSDFNWVAAPRLSIAKSWQAGTASYAAFLAYGRAYSPPTLREFRTNEGSINTDLRPEQGNSYELGIRRRSLSGFNADLNVYYQRLSQSITTFQDSEGVQLFRNAGGSNQFGVEFAVSRELLPARTYANSLFNSLRVRMAYTFQSGRYRDYRPNGNDFSGQDLPGLNPHVFDWQVSLNTRPGYYANLGLYTNSPTPLNDENDVFTDRFAELRLRIGRRFTWQGHQVDCYLGGGNLLNQTYSWGYDLNPQFGERYFQPASGTYYYICFSLDL